MNNELKEKIRAVLNYHIMNEEQLQYKNNCGEDSAQDSFERGEESGAHDVAAKILKLLDDN